MKRKSVELIYDKNGNLLKELYFDKNEKLDYCYTYDDENNSDENTNDEIIYKYDKNGKIIEESSYQQGILKWKKIIQYNEKNSQKELFFNSNSELERIITLKLDDKNNIIEEHRYDSDEKVIGKWIYDYNNQGNRIKEILYNSDGKLNEEEIYIYNEKNKLIENIIINYYEKSRSKSTYIYDDNDNEIEQLYEEYINNILTIKERTFYEYDKKGNLITIYIDDEI